MVEITKDEAMAVRAKYGEEFKIAMTCRTKKGGRKKYYMPEERPLLYFIKRMRGEIPYERTPKKRWNERNGRKK